MIKERKVLDKVTRKIHTIREDDPDLQERTCLACGITFMSIWKGNRICPNCTEFNRRNNLHGEHEHKVSK